VIWLPWLIAAAAVVAGWLVHSALYPFVKCRVCGGSGTRRGGRRTYGTCPVCKGRRRVRVGARLVRPGLRRK
jgi:hypothetical protein